MNKKYHFLLLALLVCVLFSHCARNTEDAAIDSVAPPFELKDLHGNGVSLSQFQGKVVILDFWATWCGPCRMSMPLLEKLQSENTKDLKLLAINLEEPVDMVRDYISRQNFHSTVLLDSEGKVGRAYRSESIPMQVMIDKKGIIRHIQVGFSPRMGEQLRSEFEKLRAE